MVRPAGSDEPKFPNNSSSKLGSGYGDSGNLTKPGSTKGTQTPGAVFTPASASSEKLGNQLTVPEIQAVKQAPPAPGQKGAKEDGGKSNITISISVPSGQNISLYDLAKSIQAITRASSVNIQRETVDKDGNVRTEGLGLPNNPNKQAPSTSGKEGAKEVEIKFDLEKLTDKDLEDPATIRQLIHSTHSTVFTSGGIEYTVSQDPTHVINVAKLIRESAKKNPKVASALEQYIESFKKEIGLQKAEDDLFSTDNVETKQRLTRIIYALKLKEYYMGAQGLLDRAEELETQTTTWDLSQGSR